MAWWSRPEVEDVAAADIVGVSKKESRRRKRDRIHGGRRRRGLYVQARIV